MKMLNPGKLAVPCLRGKVVKPFIPAASVQCANIHQKIHAGKGLACQSTVLLNSRLLGNTKNAILGQKLLASFTQARSFVQSSSQNQIDKGGKNEQQKPLPRLLYIQNPIVWFSNKMDFFHLRSVDPGFTEKEFTRGVRQAVSKVTQLISMNMFDSMKPLFTKGGLLTLRHDVELLWTDELKRHIAMDPNDIQLIIPRKLHFRNVNGKRLCDVDVVFIGLKHMDKKENSPLLFLDIISRFHRNYTEGVKPDWSIAAFKVRKYNIMPVKGT